MPRHNADTWTEDRVDRLKQLYVEGYSCSQIARELGVVTRNGVIGKVHRLGLEKRGIPKAQQKTRRFKHQNGRRARKISLPPELYVCAEAPDIQPLNVNLVDLSPNSCRYPYGNGPYTFCGHPQLTSSSYCREHTGYCVEISQPHPNKPPASQPYRQRQELKTRRSA